MAQNLLTISRESFELQLFKMSNLILVDLLKKVYEFKWDNAKLIEESGKVGEIETKESLIVKELQRRGYLKAKDYNDYFQFIKQHNKKKRIF